MATTSCVEDGGFQHHVAFRVAQLCISDVSLGEYKVGRF